MKGEQAYRQ